MAGPDKTLCRTWRVSSKSNATFCAKPSAAPISAPGGLWLRHLGIGGSADHYDVDAYLQPRGPLPALQRELLAHAANELIDELPAPPRAPYREDLAPPLVPDKHPGREDWKPARRRS